MGRLPLGPIGHEDTPRLLLAGVALDDYRSARETRHRTVRCDIRRTVRVSLLEANQLPIPAGTTPRRGTRLSSMSFIRTCGQGELKTPPGGLDAIVEAYDGNIQMIGSRIVSRVLCVPAEDVRLQQICGIVARDSIDVGQTVTATDDSRV